MENKLTVGETHKEEKKCWERQFQDWNSKQGKWLTMTMKKIQLQSGIKYLPFSNFDLDKKKCAWYNLLRMRLTASATLVVTQCQNICVLELMGLTMPLFCAISDHPVWEQRKKSKNQWLLKSIFLNDYKKFNVTTPLAIFRAS